MYLDGKNSSYSLMRPITFVSVAIFFAFYNRLMKEIGFHFRVAILETKV